MTRSHLEKRTNHPFGWFTHAGPPPFPPIASFLACQSRIVTRATLSRDFSERGRRAMLRADFRVNSGSLLANPLSPLCAGVFGKQEMRCGRPRRFRKNATSNNLPCKKKTPPTDRIHRREITSCRFSRHPSGRYVRFLQRSMWPTTVRTTARTSIAVFNPFTIRSVLVFMFSVSSDLAQYQSFFVRCHRLQPGQ